MNKVKYQIFVSSTYDDLKEERDQVIKACLEMGHIPVGMEMFSAADEEQWQIITRQIDESDYYVVIVANRYGSMVEGVSYTEKEYDYALSKGVPALGFVLDSKAAWPSDRLESDKKARTRLEAFKKKIKGKPVNFWTSKEDLHGKCSIALMKTFNTQPRPGWVRSSGATGPEVVEELSRLSSENAKLREEIVELSKASDISGFSQGGDTLEMAFTVFTDKWITINLLSTWNELFSIVAKAILENPAEDNIDSSICNAYKLPVLTKAASGNPPEDYARYLRITSVNLSDGSLGVFKTQFMALGLIQIRHINHNLDVKPLWVLTDRGEQFYSLTAAKRRVEDSTNLIP